MPTGHSNDPQNLFFETCAGLFASEAFRKRVLVHWLTANSATEEQPPSAFVTRVHPSSSIKVRLTPSPVQSPRTPRRREHLSPVWEIMQRLVASPIRLEYDHVAGVLHPFGRNVALTDVPLSLTGSQTINTLLQAVIERSPCDNPFTQQCGTYSGFKFNDHLDRVFPRDKMLQQLFILFHEAVDKIPLERMGDHQVKHLTVNILFRAHLKPNLELYNDHMRTNKACYPSDHISLITPYTLHCKLHDVFLRSRPKIGSAAVRGGQQPV